MVADYSVTVLLITSILLMLIILFRAKNTTLSAKDVTCSWTGDHWVTNANVKMSVLNEVIALKRSEISPDLELHEWISEKLKRPIRSSDVVYENDLTFLVIDYRSRRKSQIYIYPAVDAEVLDTRRLANE